ncbi:MAG: class I SAM-dependent methyltransferase [Candidatus Thermoplasmatota archaeon]|nr:class I SAM-dependent methyltransferase [Candidatus Thermoplasmatota archaeon]MBU4071463.1 class I SAM-dependent methyltransferase [Candidatus Thermoplasmatota archaeon]MBU4144074.1 class I SAM-dependent methyltransferase [Candidatus Thermoplasmatota archaeon]MBU4592244.1 class I SAM-dependent methyltransferase [Candidatus Thermoplasmatota archaeon]
MRKDKSSVIRTYDAIADDFDETRYKPWPDTVKFAERFSTGQLVLDLGCGNGRDLRFLEEKGIKVIGLDISHKQLEVVRRRSSSAASVVRGDVTELPFKSGIAHGAIMVATIHHIPEPEERLMALNEAHRCLLPGGFLLVGVWAAEQPKFKDNMAQAKIEFQHDWVPGDMLLDWKLPDGRVFKRYYHLFSEKEFDKLLAESEFEVEERFYSAENHYAILMK